MRLGYGMTQQNVWRIVSGDPVPRSEVQSKSLHLGDWLRRNYVSLGFDKKNRQNPSMNRFRDEMKEGDRVVVTTDGFLWALGEITGPMYEKDENRTCPRCGQSNLNIYYSDNADDRLGTWCEGCNLKAYYSGEQLVSLN